MTEPRVVEASGITYTDGSLIRYRSKNGVSVAQVTCIYPTMDPPRWDGILQPSDALADSQDHYPDEGGRRVWGYESDILAVCQY